MEISSISNALQRTGTTTKQLTSNRTDFANLVGDSGNNQSAANVRMPEVNRPIATSKPDFKNMTPAEFKNQAKTMYNNGEIDLTTLGMMQLAANVPDDNGLPATGGFDFTSIIKSKMDFETESGHMNSPISSFKIYEDIYSRITRGNGVNRVG